MAATCQIMCDSTCDFTAEQAERENIRILPFHYVEAGKPDGGLSGDDDLFQSRSAHEFYDAIRRGAMPMTSQPSQLEYDEAFQAAYESGMPTVMFCISSGLSGGYQGACASLERLKEAHPNEEVRIYVIDSLIASTSLTLLLEEACRQRDAGLNAEQLVMWAEEARYHVHTIFMVDNLDALHRGGRLPKGVAVIGDALDVKALLHFNLDGTLGIRGVARGRKKGIRKIVDFFEKTRELEPYGHVVAVGDADAPDDGYAVASVLREFDSELAVSRPTIGPTIGSHVGPGMVSCCFWGHDRRSDKQISKVKGVTRG
ncbi:DegV family protein [uncultured Parolsenella sp.]|uniref:DegV family protein n=1 Tax=uncultured Parolsenella sp. TaxID=2083008 RepID=UPI00265A8EAE|nr:DegV family protein [uncultured Parolsenella sp.]